MAETTRTSPRDFVMEVVEQVKKVTWPDQEQLKNSTAVILVFMFIVAFVILAMDVTVSHVLDLVASLFNG